MLKTCGLVRSAVAVASFLIAGSALAQGGTWQPEIGWGSVQGGKVTRNDSHRSNAAPALDLAFGYRWDNGLGVRAMFFGALDPAKDIFNQPSPRTFDEFDGVQATGYFPLAGKLNLMAGLGAGRTSLNRGVPGDHQELTEGIVSAGLQVNFVKYFSLELHADYLTRTHERNLALMAEFPF
jgi:hypothetical protein